MDLALTPTITEVLEPLKALFNKTRQFFQPSTRQSYYDLYASFCFTYNWQRFCQIHSEELENFSAEITRIRDTTQCFKEDTNLRTAINTMLELTRKYQEENPPPPGNDLHPMDHRYSGPKKKDKYPS